jgi:hypothetical protein
MLIRLLGAFAEMVTGYRDLLPLTLIVCLAAGCAKEPLPRSYMEFMEDSYAREGTLVRCNQDRAGTASDPECVSARRAAATIAARADESLREKREAESEILLTAARERSSSVRQAAQRAEADALASAEAQYEAQWTGATETLVVTEELHAPLIALGTYNSLASTLEDTQPVAESLSVATAPEVEVEVLETIELPESVQLALPYVELPESVRRLELVPQPELEEISVPDSIRYRE